MYAARLDGPATGALKADDSGAATGSFRGDEGVKTGEVRAEEDDDSTSGGG